MIKKYKNFKESIITPEYDIDEFQNDLKILSLYGTNESFDDIEKWSNHFIGDGIYKRVSEMIDDIYTALSKVDIDEFNEFYWELKDSDERLDITRLTSKIAIIQSEYSEDNVIRHNGASLISSDFLEKRSKLEFIALVLRDMIAPTIPYRKTFEEKNITDEKYQCVNFNIKDYVEIRGFINYQIRNYNIENYFKLYYPGIYIDISSVDRMVFMPLNELEESLDRILPYFLSELDYSDISWDFSRYNRQFDDSISISAYNFKIILNT